MQLFTSLYYIPFYCMSVRGASSTKAGIDIFPALFLFIPGSIIVAGLTTRLGRFRWSIWVGWAISTLGCGLMLLFGLHTTTAVFAIVLAVFGIGSGMVVTGVNVGIQAISKVEDAAMAACMYGFMRSLGMPLGVALSGTIFQNAMSNKLSAYGLSTSIAQDSERYVYILRTLDETTRTPILESYMHGFRALFVMMTCVSASTLTVSLVIKKFDMNKTLLSKYSAR